MCVRHSQSMLASPKCSVVVGIILSGMRAELHRASARTALSVVACQHCPPNIVQTTQMKKHQILQHRNDDARRHLNSHPVAACTSSATIPESHQDISTLLHGVRALTTSGSIETRRCDRGVHGDRTAVSPTEGGTVPMSAKANQSRAEGGKCLLTPLLGAGRVKRQAWLCRLGVDLMHRLPLAQHLWPWRWLRRFSDTYTQSSRTHSRTGSPRGRRDHGRSCEGRSSLACRRNGASEYS